ncbi:MAG: hypothetical protein R3E66_07090 [bacterium]
MTHAKLLFIAGLVTLAACASAPQAPVVRETVSEPAPVETKTQAVTPASEEAPKGEISLDGAQDKEVDLGIEGTTTGPVVVDRVVTDTPEPVMSIDGQPLGVPALEEAVKEEMKKLEDAKKAADAKKSKKKPAEPVEEEKSTIIAP